MPKKSYTIDNEDRVAFGKRLESLSEKAQDLVDILGIGRTSIYNYFKGYALPSFDILFKLAKARPDIDLNWLLTGEYYDKENYLKISDSKIQNIDELSMLLELQNELIAKKDLRIKLLEEMIAELKKG